ncbi:MAG: chlororespiratory reduction 6 domain-containing protein [Elainella sp. Prado103]|nr:chlororespiratory reduction 6 domain-containing protein [Elainella sp. Prado103]
MMDGMISKVGYLSFAIPKSEVVSGSLDTLEFMIKSLTKNREMMLQKRTSASVFFPEYDSDPRELYQIPEVRRWFLKTMMQGVPWFYFLEQITGMGLQLLFACTCEVTYIGTKGNKHGLYATLEEKQWWLEHNFMNLNKFTEANDIPLKINKEISYGIEDWFIKTFGVEEPDVSS